MAVVIPTDRLKSVLTRCVIEVFGGVFVLSLCCNEFSVAVRASVIRLSKTSSFFLLHNAMRPSPGHLLGRIDLLYKDKKYTLSDVKHIICRYLFFHEMTQIYISVISWLLYMYARLVRKFIQHFILCPFQGSIIQHC